MKKFIFNSVDSIRIMRANEIISNNEESFKERFGKQYEFIKNYPFVLNIPEDKAILADVCERCNQSLPRDKYIHTWNEGFRPEAKDFVISLGNISEVLALQKNCSIELKEEVDEFVREFREAFN